MNRQADQYYKTVLNKWKSKDISSTGSTSKSKHQFNKSGYKPYFFDESYMTRNNAAFVTPEGKLQVHVSLSGLPLEGPLTIYPFGVGQPIDFQVDGTGTFVADDATGTVELERSDSCVRITKFIKQGAEIQFTELILPVTVAFCLTNGRTKVEDKMATPQ